jgi:hypothetical protein
MWDDIEIVSLDLAKAAVRCTTSDEDDLDKIYLAQAHALVLDYVQNARDDDYIAEMLTWDDETAPRAVQAAIMRQFADLRRFRGNDDSNDVKIDGNFLSPRVLQLLKMYHDPTLA